MTNPSPLQLIRDLLVQLGNDTIRHECSLEVAQRQFDGGGTRTQARLFISGSAMVDLRTELDRLFLGTKPEPLAPTPLTEEELAWVRDQIRKNRP